MNEESSRVRGRVHFETKLVVEHDGEEHVFARTFDVSMNGVFVKTAKPLPMGAICPFLMTISFGMKHEDIEGECEVVRVVSLDDGLSESESGPGMGLKFMGLSSESTEVLFNIIRYNQPPA